MNAYEIRSVIQQIQYKSWQLYFNDDEYYIQWQFVADGETQKGRKWIVSSHMTKSEIVSTAFKAALTAEEHECRESFKYRNKRIFGPHFDVDVLVEIAGKKANLDLRDEIPV